MTVGRTMLRVPMARVQVDKLFYVGVVVCGGLMLERSPLFDLIIGNRPGTRRSDDPDTEWAVATAVATTAQARGGKEPKHGGCEEQMSMNKKDLIRL